MEDDMQFIKGDDVFYVAFEGAAFNNFAILDDYETGSIIGEGGFGQVMLGTHKHTKKKVAIKFMDVSESRKCTHIILPHGDACVRS